MKVIYMKGTNVLGLIMFWVRKVELLKEFREVQSLELLPSIGHTNKLGNANFN